MEWYCNISLLWIHAEQSAIKQQRLYVSIASRALKLHVCLSMFLLLTLPIRSSSIFFVFFFPLHSPFFFSTACLNPLNSLILSFPPAYKTYLSPPQTFAFLFLSLSHKRYYSFSNLCLCIVFFSLSLSLWLHRHRNKLASGARLPGHSNRMQPLYP